MFLIALLYSSFSFSQNKVTYDTTKIVHRKFSDAKIKEFKSSNDFVYDRVKPPESLKERILNWIWKIIQKMMSNQGIAPYIRYLLFTALVVFIIILILKNDVKAIFFGSGKKQNLEYKEIADDITKMNLDELIQSAKQKNNYRLAVRYLFLKLLKLLSESELINWKINKTNRDYIEEMNKTKLNHLFLQLTGSYEYIWYGDFKINEKAFSKIETEFKDAFVQVNNN